MDASLGRLLKQICLLLLACEVHNEEVYLGCYQELLGILKMDSVQNVSQCVTECRNELSAFAAIKNGSICYCGNKISSRLPLSKCNLTCPDSKGICGGIDSFSVHTGVPPYHGCFKDDIHKRDMNLMVAGDWDMTIDKCYFHCLRRKYKFMGLQFGGSCFCGNTYGKYGRTQESECNVTCTKNRNQICGGPARSNIYSIDYFPGLNKSYSEIFHCLNSKPDRNGACPGSRCQHGWTGRKCNQRDCLKSNGKCGEHKCNIIEIGNQFASECLCKEGFQLDSIKEECLDVDECFTNICNESTSICNNSVGSYDCICKTGFAHGSNTKDCEDIDECSLEVCNDLTSTCNNSFGSFICICKDGFIINGTSKHCEDVDECTSNVCDASTSICNNTVGSYECHCKEGFFKNSSSEDCKDINECISNPCNISTSTCNNTVGSFNCTCKQGFRRNSSDNSDCTDIDECQSNPCNVSSETCINTVGSFMCVCSSDYKYSEQRGCANCGTNLFMCHNLPTCQLMQGYLCQSHEIRRETGTLTKGIKHKNILLVFITFLAILLGSLLIFAVRKCSNKEGENRKETNDAIRFQNVNQDPKAN